MAALAAMALMVGAFTLPATLPVAYADSTQVKVQQKNNCYQKGSFASAQTCDNIANTTVLG
jgi:hypothetical protein